MSLTIFDFGQAEKRAAWAYMSITEGKDGAGTAGVTHLRWREERGRRPAPHVLSSISVNVSFFTLYI